MALVSITVTTIDGLTPSKALQAIDTKDIVEMVSSTDISSGLAWLKVRRWDGRPQGAVARLENWVSSSTYAVVLAAINAVDAEQGAELLSNKDATGGYVGKTLFKVNLTNDANTFTSTLANTNLAARAYTLPDVAGGILVGAKIATGALTAGVRSVTVTGASTTSTATVMTVALGGTVAAGGYKVACTANTVTITALQADGTTTETSCTSTVQGICIL